MNWKKWRIGIAAALVVVFISVILIIAPDAPENKGEPTPSYVGSQQESATEDVTPTPVPTKKTTATPKPEPTAPVYLPTVAPTATVALTKAPTVTVTPAEAPTATVAPTEAPTATVAPTEAPTVTVAPTKVPTATVAPTEAPIVTVAPAGTSKMELVSEGYYDDNVIPDKYNTGCSGTLTKINRASTVDGVEYSIGNNGDAVVLDWYYRNKKIADEIVIRDKDFSDKTFCLWHASMIDTTKIVRFENCKFSVVAAEYEQKSAQYYFANCTFVNFYGSNATFENCYFGGSYHDGINPLKNVTLRDCYFAGYDQSNTEGKHSDAVQIYGKADIDAENILFENCRIEIPIIKSDKKPQINACFMVQLEFSNARNFLFENCIINGGGYSIYARSTNPEFVLENVVFRNISIGSAHLYGDLYPHVGETVEFDNLYDTEKLYVASVWKDAGGKVHLSVSNDTAEERVLVVVTEAGKEEILIGCKNGAEQKGAVEFEDLPMDLDIVISDPDTEWVVCYDGEETEEHQIRFVNWGDEAVYRVTN